MDIRLTRHARAKLAKLGLSREEVAAIIQFPAARVTETTADEYEGWVRGALVHVVVVKGSQPPLVITVYNVDVQGESGGASLR